MSSFRPMLSLKSQAISRLFRCGLSKSIEIHRLCRFYIPAKLVKGDTFLDNFTISVRVIGRSEVVDKI